MVSVSGVSSSNFFHPQAIQGAIMNRVSQGLSGVSLVDSVIGTVFSPPKMSSSSRLGDVLALLSQYEVFWKENLKTSLVGSSKNEEKKGVFVNIIA